MKEAEVATLLRDAAPMPEPSDFAPPETIVRLGRRRRVQHRVVTSITTVAVIAIVGAIALPRLGASDSSLAEGAPSSSSTSTSVSTPPPSRGFMLGRPIGELFNPSEPLLPGGRSVSPGEAASLVRYTLYLPTDASLPSPEVWVVQEVGDDGMPFFDAAARYDSGVVITYGTWSAGRDPAAEYQKLAAESKAGYVTAIAGHPAWVVPAGSPNTEDPRISAILVSIGDVEVALLGLVPLPELLAAASSLAPA